MLYCFDCISYLGNRFVLFHPIPAREKIVANVEKLTQVPTGEQPTIAKISDITKLNKQPFFEKAQNGDFVLIYTKAKEAILYDPNTNKVLRVGPILVPSPT